MRRMAGCIALFLTIVVFGCSKGGVKSVDVAGTISLDGKPLEGVEVFFSTDKFEGFGKTDAAGKYRLVNGAAVGTNKVYLKKVDTAGVKGIDQSIPGMDDGQAAAMAAAQSGAPGTGKSASIIPAEYSDVKTTKLTFPVPEGGSESADFRISSAK